MPSPHADKDVTAYFPGARMVHHSLSKYLLSVYYMAGIVSGAGEGVRQIQTDRGLPSSVSLLVERQRQSNKELQSGSDGDRSSGQGEGGPGVRWGREVNIL